MVVEMVEHVGTKRLDARAAENFLSTENQPPIALRTFFGELR